jgi:15-cis-phytoene synthase
MSAVTLEEADPTAFAAARDVCRRHARSFYLASFFLPRPKRYAAYAVYGFCRMIDDAIACDEAPAGPSTVAGACCSNNELDAKLQMFRQRLDDIYADRLEVDESDPQQLAVRAFASTVHRYQIPQQYFLDLAQGYRMDRTIKRYATWAALGKYCYHAAGVVGLIMCGVLGLTHSDAQRNAILMGNAMRLTNVLRDLKEDQSRGRIYLPLEDLARFRYSERELARGVVNDNFRELMRFEIARARRMYNDAAGGLCWLAGDGSRLTVSAIATIYSGILTAIERNGYDVFRRRADLTTAQKFRRLPQAWRLAKRRNDEPLPARVF